MKLFSLLNYNCIVLCELLMPCQLFAQKCSNCQEITKISKNVRGPPEYSAIGNINLHTFRDILLLGVITLQHVIENNFPVGLMTSAFWWYGPLSEDQEKF